MKQFLLPLIVILVLSSCGSSKTYLERNDADQALQDAVKKLAKDKNDDDALSALPILYNNIKMEPYCKNKKLQQQQRHYPF